MSTGAGPRVLVCDDELQILRALRVILRDAGFEVTTAATAQEALDKAAVGPVDAAILDLVLPDGNGVDVCRSIREWSDMPIIVLSAMGEEEQKVLRARGGRGRLRDEALRPERARGSPASGAAQGWTRARPTSRSSAPKGSSWIRAAHRVHVDDEEVHLTPTEFDLLRTLMRNRGRLMTHRALLTDVWGVGYEHDTQVLRVHLANLRRKIEPTPNSPRRHHHRPWCRLPLRGLGGSSETR